MTCDRVLLMHHGTLRADDTPQNLVRKLRVASDVIVELKGKGNLEEELSRITGVRRVTEESVNDGWHRFSIRVEARADIREIIADAALQHGWQIRELHRDLPSLEDVFAEMTSSEQ